MKKKRQTFDVDLAALLRVFGGHLYSTPAVFARELVQNALDAVAVRRRADSKLVPQIVVEVDPVASVVRFFDNGIGLDEEGLQKHLSSVGTSSKRQTDRSEVIGQFGIGLLSSFLVADDVAVHTRTKGGPPLRWSARSDGSYEIDVGPREEQGTEVVLTLRDDMRDFATVSRMRELLETYVPHVRVPISLRVRGGESAIVTQPGLWEVAEAERAAATAASIGAPPLATLPIATDVAKGVLWIRSQASALDAPSLRLYHQGILVDRAATGLLPRWAGFVGGVVDAGGLSPTASRESFVRDAAWHAFAASLSRALIGFLANLADRDPALMDEVLSAHTAHILAACVDDAALLAGCGGRIPFQSNRGVIVLDDQPSSAELIYTTSQEDFGVAAPLCAARGATLIDASHVHEAEFLEAWRRHSPSPELTRLDLTGIGSWFDEAPEQRLRFAALLVAAKKLLLPLHVEPVLRRFSPTELPVLLLADPNQLRERAEAVVRGGNPLARALVGGLSIAQRAPLTPLVLNVDNAIISALPELMAPETGARVIRMLYVQAAQKLRRVPSMIDSRSFADDLLHILRSPRIEADHGGTRH